MFDALLARFKRAFNGLTDAFLQTPRTREEQAKLENRFHWERPRGGVMYPRWGKHRGTKRCDCGEGLHAGSKLSKKAKEGKL